MPITTNHQPFTASIESSTTSNIADPPGTSSTVAASAPIPIPTPIAASDELSSTLISTIQLSILSDSDYNGDIQDDTVFGAILLCDGLMVACSPGTILSVYIE